MSRLDKTNGYKMNLKLEKKPIGKIYVKTQILRLNKASVELEKQLLRLNETNAKVEKRK